MRQPRHLPRIVLLLSLTAGTAFGQATLESVYVYRSAEGTQTGADPTWVEEGGGYWINYTQDRMGWGFTVNGSGLSAPTLTTMPLAAGNNNSTLNASQHNGGVLGLSGDGNSTEWRYGSPNFDNISWTASGANALDRNSRFPVGTYTVAIPDFDDVTLNYQHSSVDLNAPLFTLSGGVWSGGVYVVNASSTVSITGSQHNGFLNHNVNGAIWFDITDADGNTLPGSDSLRFRTDAEPGDDFISYTIDPMTLTAGESYRVDAGHIYIMDQSAVNGSLNLAFFEAATSFTISAVPEPSTYATFAGLVVFGCVWWRRRR